MKILVVKTHAIGDLLLITPSIRELKKLYPESSISVLTGRWSAPVLEDNPYIDEVITFDDSIFFKKKWLKIVGLIKKLREKKFDKAFIFQPSLKVRLLIYLAGIKERIGLSFLDKDYFLTKSVYWDPNGSKYVGENYFDLVHRKEDLDYCLGMELFLTDSEREKTGKYLLNKGNTGKKKLIGIAPGGGKNPRDDVSMKIWNKDRYVGLIENINKENEAEIILFGAKSDKEICNYIKSQLSFNVIDSCGEVDLRGLMGLIERCDLLVTNDSAPVHFGLALKVPIVVIFGPSNPYALLPEKGNYRAVISTAECSPCYSNAPFEGCETPCCMDLIGVEDVFNAVKEMLE